MKRTVGIGLRVIVVLLASGTWASAQVGGAFDAPGPQGSDQASGGVWLSVPIKGAILAVLAALSWTVGFLLIFPWMLRKSRPAWPLDAFGVSAALVWLTTWFLALVIFWEELVLVDIKFGEWLLRCVFVSVAIIGGLLFRAIYRSHHPASPVVKPSR
jgi:hypothetical protein